MESVCYQSVSEWDQVGNYMQSVCDELVKTANLTSSTYTEVHRSYLHSDSSQKLKFKNCSTNCDAVAAGQQFTLELT